MHVEAYKSTWAEDSIAPKYFDFMKSCFNYHITPNYYGVKKSRKISTRNGDMLVLKIYRDMIDEPNVEIIAEAYFNTMFMYYYLDKYWCLAVDANGTQLASPTIPTNKSLGLATLAYHTKKTIVLYPI